MRGGKEEQNIYKEFLIWTKHDSQITHNKFFTFNLKAIRMYIFLKQDTFSEDEEQRLIGD